MILFAKPIIESKKGILQAFFANHQDQYIAILFFGNSPGSEVYVRNKVRFGEDIGCKVNIIGQVLDQAKRQKVEQANGDDIKSLILELNNDSDCIGIVIQLPLPDYLQSHQQEFCDMIEPSKDIDCMTSRMLGRVAAGRSDVVYPAAVGATIEMLRFYALDNLKGKQVSIIGQSNLIGKPMALYCIGQGAQVHSFGVDGDEEMMQEICGVSDYIISATGVVGLVNSTYIKEISKDKQMLTQANEQIIIDIGYGFTPEGKPVGDVCFDEVKDLVFAISPVPGGIGALCVCQLFENVMKLKIQSASL